METVTILLLLLAVLVFIGGDSVGHIRFDGVLILNACSLLLRSAALQKLLGFSY